MWEPLPFTLAFTIRKWTFLTLQFVFCMNTPNNNKICSMFLDYSTLQGCFGFDINNHYSLNFLPTSDALVAYKICCSTSTLFIYISDFVQTGGGRTLHQFQLFFFFFNRKIFYSLKLSSTLYNVLQNLFLPRWRSQFPLLQRMICFSQNPKTGWQNSEQDYRWGITINKKKVEITNYVLNATQNKQRLHSLSHFIILICR